MTPTVLMISKPVAPPFNDSSKNLVRDLVCAGSRYRYHVLTPRGEALDALRVTSEPVYGDAGAYTPALLQNARVLARLLRRDDTALAHFFFAPNPRASAAARLALRLRPRRVVQTVCSIPGDFAGASRLLFAPTVIVLSQHTHDRFVEAGVSPARLRIIGPGIRIPRLPDHAERLRAREALGLPQQKPVLLYAGDYQFSSAADTVARAVPLLGDLDATFVFACRIKQAASRAEEARIRRLVLEAGVAERVRLWNEVRDMRQLLTAADLCLLPADSLYAKMDLPLVLLEAMALGVPLVVADRPPLTELVRDGGGVCVPPGSPGALADAIRRLLTSPGRRAGLGADARRVVETNHSIEHISRRHEDLYDELLQR